VPGQELGVLAREDIVRHDTQPQRVAQRAAQREDQRGLAATNRSADTDGERARREIAPPRCFAVVETAGMVPVLVMMIVVGVVTDGGS
jgi:hypothetical protein